MKTMSLLFVLLAAACGGNENGFGYAKEANMEEVVEDFADLKAIPKIKQPQPDSDSDIQQKIIKTGNLSYKVDKTKSEYDKILKSLSNYDAYLANENQQKGYDRINYTLSIKVPPQYFDSLMNQLTLGKKIDNKWVNSDNVTNRYYDLQSRIVNKKKLEKRYQEILSKANSISDILEVERNLNQVRSEIESLQGQFKLLSYKISYSTLNVTFYEILPYEMSDEQHPGFLARISNALSGGWKGFISFLILTLRLWPFIILGIGVLILLRKIRVRKAK